MSNESYLEYLALDSILQGYMTSNCLNYKEKNAQFWYADDSTDDIDLTKLRKRVGELQKEFMKPYVCDSKPS